MRTVYQLIDGLVAGDINSIAMIVCTVAAIAAFLVARDWYHRNKRRGF